MSRLPGLLAVLGVTVAAAGITVGVAELPTPARSKVLAAQQLPQSLSAPTLVCPGPETLLVPDGGKAVAPGAPVLLRALVSSSSGSSSARLKLLGHNSAKTTHSLNDDASPPSLGPPGSGSPGSSSDRTGLARVGRNLALTSDVAQGPVIGTLAATALGPAVLTADQPSPGQTTPPALAAIQSTLARSGDLRGLTTTACAAPQPDSWLVGGATGDGERLRLLLANPAAAPAVVDVEVHGPDGRVNAPSGDGIVVPAGDEVPLYIDALAPGLARVAVHVTTRSGRVRATLHDTVLRGLVPSGADDVPVAAAAAKRQVVPGVSLVDGDVKTAVRIAVPGSEDAVVRVRLLSSTGAVDLPRTGVVTVSAGGVADVPISGVPSGTYTAVVDADVPVVAGALVGRSGIAGTAPSAEFAWAAAARRLAGDGYAVLPPGARSTLSLVAVQGTGGLVLTGMHSDGTLGRPIDVDVPDATSVTVQLDADVVAIRISALRGAAVAGAIVATVDDARGPLISVLPLDLVAPATAPATAIEDSSLGLR
jgi:hypothetical protein